jgi:hypothetical protein
MNTQTHVAEVSASIPAVMSVKRGPGRPPVEGDTVVKLRAEVKALSGWTRGRGCHKMNKAALVEYRDELKRSKTAN